MFKRRLLWFLAFAASPLIASPQVTSSAENSAACVPQAYVGNLLPIFQPFATLPEFAYDKFDETGTSNVSVTVLVTVGPEGRVTGAEALGGPEFLRETSTDTVRHYRYQPVIRNGQPARNNARNSNRQKPPIRRRRLRQPAQVAANRGR